MPSQRSSLSHDYDYDSAEERRRSAEHSRDPERRRAGRSDEASADREISLGTGTILGIFFALAVTCGVFFGFGYQMGHHASSAATTTDPAAVGDASSSEAASHSTSKPSANSPLQAAKDFFSKKEAPAATTLEAASDSAAVEGGGSEPAATKSSHDQAFNSNLPGAQGRQSAVQNPATAETANRGESSSPNDSVRTLANQSVNAAASNKAAPARNQTTLVRATANYTATPAANAQPAAQPVAATATGTFIVQVAAVSHQEDAELLDSALNQRGYAVFVRQEPQDHLLHVQVGPFASRRDADLIRQRLLNDGYNAIVK